MDNPSLNNQDSPSKTMASAGGGAKNPAAFVEIAHFSARLLLDNLNLFLSFGLIRLFLFWAPFVLALNFFSGNNMVILTSSLFNFFFIWPLILLAQCRLVLRVWDGENIGLSVFQWAFSQYFDGLGIVLCDFCYNLGLSLLLLFIFLPSFLVFKLVSLNLGGGPGTAAAFLASATLAAFLIKTFAWQPARRILTMLVPINGFACTEDSSQNWWASFSRTYRNLNAPTLAPFLNQFLAVILILEAMRLFCFHIFMGLGSGYPWLAFNLILDTIMVLAELWLYLAAAGFYRLNYRPGTDSYSPDSL